MIKQFFKKVLISYLIIICCIFTPTYRAYAVSAGGWAFISFNVATSVVTAMKNGASASVAVAKSPITAKIAKGVAGGVIAGAAIPLVISQATGIALGAIDWLSDPANNSVKYKPKTAQYCASFGNDVPRQCFASGDALCNAYADYLKPKGYTGTATYSASVSGCVNASGGRMLSITSFDPNQYKSIPISAVADKIYENAKTDSDSASVVNNAAREYVNEGSADTALDSAKADADASHSCGTGTHWSGSACVADTPSTPSTPTTPDTSFDPSSIIDAIASLFDAVMSIPSVINSAIDKVLDAIASITDVINNAINDLLVDIKDFFQPIIDKFTDFVEWVKTEPTPVQAEPVDIQTPDMPKMESTDISFGGQCPQNFDIDIDLFGKPVKFTLFDSTVFCQFLSDWIRIPVIFSASLVAVYILGGRRSD